MMILNDILKIACEQGYSDMYLSVGASILGRRDSDLNVVVECTLSTEDMINYAKDILNDQFVELDVIGEKYKSFSISGIGRFRANIFKQRNSIAISIKVVSIDEFNNKIGLPDDIYNYISQLNSGLVLMIGSIRSGKNLSTSYLIENISKTYSKYIITIESTIEILHKHNKSIVNQREVGTDTASYITGIESAFREKPDILVIDDIPDYQVLKLLLKCCDAGILVIATHYSNSIKATLEYLLDMDSKSNLYLRNSLSNSLRCVVNHKNILDVNDNNLYLFEFMINSPSIANCIKENNIKNIFSLISNSVKLGMYTMDMSLINAYKSGKISRSTLVQNISNKEVATKIILNY